MTYGLTTEGFIVKRLPEIKESIRNAIKELFPNIDIADDSVTGQMISLQAQRDAELWEQAHNIYNEQHPSEAASTGLDYILEFKALTRLQASKSQLIIGFNGELNTEIPKDTQVKNEYGNIFVTKEDALIYNGGLLKAYLRINEVADNTIYEITINETETYSIDSGISATAESIAASLILAITEDVDSPIIAVSPGSGDITLETKSGTFLVEFDPTILFFCPINCESQETGEISVVAYSIDKIETPVGGLDNVNNFEDGVKGRATETDAEARIRFFASTISEAGTLPAIVSFLQDEVEDVITVKGYENRTDTIDGFGRPPHSIHIIIEGGDDDEIADLLWKSKPGGIQLFGSEEVEIIDSNGDTQIINFDRPIPKYAWINIVLTLGGEEIFPADGLLQVKQKVFGYGDDLQIGKDIIPQRFYGSIFEVPGIESIFIEIAITDDPGGSPIYQEETITIDVNEKSIFDQVRINVVEA